MYNFINKALSASIVFGLVITMGVFVAFAESDNNAGIHIPDTEISVYSPITDMFDCEINVNIQSLPKFSIRSDTSIRLLDMGRVQCENVFTTHQNRIDSILALICKYDVDNLHELSILLQALQNECCCSSTVPFGCAGGCVLIPVWVTINGVRHPGYRCLNCGRVFI